MPEALADVIGRCLSRSPATRPPSMRALEYELTRAVDGRATAVAAVLGLGSSGDSLEGRAPDDPSPAASASFHRAAIAALDAPPPGYSPPDRTVIAPPPRGPSGTGAPSRAQTAAIAAGKALLFVALGGLLSAAAVIALRPELLDRVAADDTGERPAPRIDEAIADVPTDARSEVKIEPPPPLPPPRLDAPPTTPPPIVLEDAPAKPESVPVKAPDEAQLVEMAEAAIKDKHWREPAEGSLALALANLALVDPGNPKITKLREAAAASLLPAATLAFDRKRWAGAVTAYRDLTAVWPEHDEARVGLGEALHQQARVYKRLREWEHVLASADELLVVSPDDFRAVVMRAEALMAMKKYGEAKAAYVAARKLKPKNKDVQKGYWKAYQLAKKQQG
jgi:tetratricopeptide (TPR) repeat protein